MAACENAPERAAALPRTYRPASVMPEPTPQPDYPILRRTALTALIAGLCITGVKFAVYFMVGSVAVLGDAFESIVNVVAAGLMLFSLAVANRPADAEHRYGHGKIEFMAVGFEGVLILLAGVVVAFQAAARLVGQQELPRLEVGIVLLGGVSVLTGALAWYVLRAGHRHGNAVLIADGRHLLADFVTTVGVLAAMVLVKWTQWLWLDPAAALVIAASLMRTSWRLLTDAANGLMDRADPADDSAIRAVLDAKVEGGLIHGYHKLRHRHSGAFHWVDVHIQVDGRLTVRKSHELASGIEHEIERTLGQANVTAHVEPPEAAEDSPPAAAVSHPPDA
jgi:cation diffusion facilitator family transporter